MRIGVLTTCFNEELMLPFFLHHYQDQKWDNVVVMLDRQTTDRSAEVCSHFPNTIIKECGMKAGLQEIEKVEILQRGFNEMAEEGFDWIAVLDSDELIVPFECMLPGAAKQLFYKQAGYECMFSTLFPVFRYIEDKDLDPSKAALLQRLHGGQPRSNEIKPNILRALPDAKLTIGMHTLGKEYKVSPNFFIGAHWADADPSLSIPRRLSRQARFSKDNWANGWGVQHQGISEYSVRAEAAEHLYDPLIPALAKVVGLG